MMYDTMTAAEAERAEKLVNTLKNGAERMMPVILTGTVDSPVLTEDTAVLAGVFTHFVTAMVDETAASVHSAIKGGGNKGAVMASAGVRMASRIISYFHDIEDEYRPYAMVIYKIDGAEDYLTELLMRVCEASSGIDHILDIIRPYPLAMMITGSGYTEVLTTVRDNIRSFRNKIIDMRRHAGEYKSSDDLPEECFSRINEIETLSWYALAFMRFIEAAFPGRKTEPIFSLNKIADVTDPMVTMASQSLMFEKSMGSGSVIHENIDARAGKLGEAYNEAYREVKEILSDNNNRFGLHIGRVRGLSETPDEEYYTVLTNGDSLNAAGAVFGCRIMAMAYLIIMAKPEKIMEYLIGKGAVDKAVAGRPSTADAIREKAIRRHESDSVPVEVMDKMVETKRLISAYADFCNGTVTDGASWLEGFLAKDRKALPAGVNVSADVMMEEDRGGNEYFPLMVSVYDNRAGKRYTMILAVLCSRMGVIREGSTPLYRTDGIISGLGELIKYGVEWCDKVLAQRSDGDDVDIDMTDPAVYTASIPEEQ